jgi:hypothetical protein
VKTVFQLQPTIFPIKGLFPMSQSPDNYHAWVLRFWRENPLGPWRIALEAIATGERKGFPDLDSLNLYLKTHFIVEEPVIEVNQIDE